MGKPNRRPRRGFFIIFGWRTCAMRDGTDPVKATCPGCEQEAWMTGKIRRRWFTLFFLPVFPIDSAEHAERVTQCGHCKAMFDCGVEQIARMNRQGPRHDWQESIELYNKLRDDPTNSALLLELLQCYEAMNEPSEALSIARYFPVALQNSPQAQTILARMRGAADSGESAPQLA